MGWSFRRRIKIIPGLYLNVSKRGVSASVGGRGASLTFQNNGVYSNVSIPGTGLYSRQRLGRKSSSKNLPDRSVNSGSSIAPQHAGLGADPDIEYISADPLQVNSPGLEGLREAIVAANRQRESLQNDLASIQSSIRLSDLYILFSKLFLAYFLFSGFRARLQSDLKIKRTALRGVERSIRDSTVPLTISLDQTAKDEFQRLAESFKELATSHYIWDVTYANSVNMAKTRSAASMQVGRSVVKLTLGNVPGIDCPWNALRFANNNGGDLYFYPGFMILCRSSFSLGILELKQLRIGFAKTRFVESAICPHDSIQVSQVWERSNKDGSPDRRYSDNRQLPVMEYGELTFCSSLGLNEKYLVSDVQKLERFYLHLVRFIDSLL